MNGPNPLQIRPVQSKIDRAVHVAGAAGGVLLCGLINHLLSRQPVRHQPDPIDHVLEDIVGK